MSEEDISIIDALDQLEKERGIPKDYMIDQICKAITTACKNSYGNDEEIGRASCRERV